MALQPVDGGSGGVANEAYTLVAAVRTSRVRSDNTVQDVIQWTAQSALYGVTFTKFTDPQAWNLEARTAIIGPVVAEVNEVCAYRHVQGFRTVQDQDASQLLVNWAVITVGTDDGAITDEVTVRMDAINDVATFQAIDAAWAVLEAAGAS